MTAITRRTALGALGSLIGLGLAGTITQIPTDAKKHKHKRKKKHKKGNKGNNNTGSNQNPGGGTLPPPPPQFEFVERTFSHDGAVGISATGQSNEYPSEILVSGLEGGVITDLNVRFPGFQHDLPDDVDMLLVGPQGENMILLSDIGGDVQGTVLFDLTIDDQAAAPLPTAGPLSDGSFKPFNDFGSVFTEPDFFPTPAPAASGATSLSVFNGTDPNGTWKLFIVDDAAGDGGVLINGWSLTIIARIPVQP